MLDLKIVGGTIVDGTGKPGFAGDVGIRDGRIVAVGTVTEDAARTIDAKGRVVAPGFVDSHTHYDAQVFWDPTLSPSCYHGVTTVVGGFCGFSIAPLTRESAPYVCRMLARVEGMPLDTLKAVTDWSWSSFGDYLDRVERGGIGVNAGFFVGHSAIRRAVMAERAVGEKATPAEIAAMADLLDTSLAEGALGFSTTMSPTHSDYEGQPVPSRWADREEFLALARVVSRHEGTGLEMLPDLAFPEGTPELMADFSIAGQRPVNWNVLVVSGPDAAERATRMLAITDFARARGGEVIALTMPRSPGVYMTLKSGMMFDSLPGLWSEIFRRPQAEREALFRDPEARRRLAEDAASMPEGVPLKSFANLGNYTVISTVAEDNRRYEGRTVGAIAAEEGREVIDVMLDIASVDDFGTVFSPRQGGDDRAAWEVRGKVWADDRTLVGASDAGAHLDLIDSFDYSTTLLAQGVREQQVISLEEAVHQITLRPAAYFGLVERGAIREGWHADLVIFDPATVAGKPMGRRHDLPGDAEAYRIYAEAVGIDHVLVNGVEIVRHGEHTGALPGTLLRSGRDTRTVPLDVMQRKAA